MAWKKVTPEMDEFLERSVSGFKCQRRQMFGCPVYFVNGNMFAGLHQDDLMVRLSEEDREKVMEEYDQARLFEPVKGRKMKEYVVLPEELYSDEDLFHQWLERSYGYASSLPAKRPRDKGGWAVRTKGGKSAGGKGKGGAKKRK